MCDKERQINLDRFSFMAEVNATQKMTIDEAGVDWGSIDNIHETTEIIIYDQETSLQHRVYAGNMDDEEIHEEIMKKLAEIETGA